MMYACALTYVSGTLLEVRYLIQYSSRVLLFYNSARRWRMSGPTGGADRSSVRPAAFVPGLTTSPLLGLSLRCAVEVHSFCIGWQGDKGDAAVEFGDVASEVCVILRLRTVGGSPAVSWPGWGRLP